MKTYYADKGGAFRLFITNNKIDTFVIDYDTSLTSLEKEFISEYAAKFGFKNNLHPISNLNNENIYEWYNIGPALLKHIKSQKKEHIKDINGNHITLKNLEKARKASEYIRNKINFYRLIKNINPDFLVPNTNIEKLDSTIHAYPFIIKSVQGKGGKGNIVCFSENDLSMVQSVFSSELFASKQENNRYNINRKVIVEKFFPNAPSYNYSFYCNTKGRISQAHISQQIIDEVFYRGNIYPSDLTLKQEKSIKQIGKEICRYIHKEYGFIGWIGLDFIIINNKVYVLEANPRVNSVTHAHQLANGNAFIIKLLKHQNKSVKSIFNNFFFDHTSLCGILPYQIPNQEEILLISIHSSLEQAIQQLEIFKTQNSLTDVTQENIKPYSKSVSYYVAKMK